MRLRESSCSSREVMPPVRPDGMRRLVPCSWRPAVGGTGVGGGGALRWAVPGRGEREGVHAGFGALCVALRKRGWRALERSQPLLILDALQCASYSFVPVLRERAPPAR